MAQDSQDFHDSPDTYDVAPRPEPPANPVASPPSVAAPPPAPDPASTDDTLDIEDIQNNRPMAVLSYIGPFVVVPLVFARESRFARFHSNQGLVLFILEFALWTLTWVLSFLFMPEFGLTSSGFFNAIAHFYGFAAGITWAIFAVLSFAGIFHAVSGTEDKLPLIGHVSIVRV